MNDNDNTPIITNRVIPRLTDALSVLDDPMDALQFCDEPDFPLNDDARDIARLIRTIWKRHHNDYFSDSSVNDILALFTNDSGE